VIESSLERVITLFGVRQRDSAKLLFFRIVIEVDVLSPQDTLLKMTILDLVLSEVAVLRRRRRRGSSAQHEQRYETGEALSYHR
jgi:hypothetical protein